MQTTLPHRCSVATSSESTRSSQGHAVGVRVKHVRVKRGAGLRSSKPRSLPVARRRTLTNAEATVSLNMKTCHVAFHSFWYTTCSYVRCSHLRVRMYVFARSHKATSNIATRQSSLYPNTSYLRARNARIPQSANNSVSLLLIL
eukprot:5815981-Pyramimonas_sp.AAC.2